MTKGKAPRSWAIGARMVPRGTADLSSVLMSTPYSFRSWLATFPLLPINCPTMPGSSSKTMVQPSGGADSWPLSIASATGASKSTKAFATHSSSGPSTFTRRFSPSDLLAGISMWAPVLFCTSFKWSAPVPFIRDTQFPGTSARTKNCPPPWLEDLQHPSMVSHNIFTAAPTLSGFPLTWIVAGSSVSLVCTVAPDSALILLMFSPPRPMIAPLNTACSRMSRTKRSGSSIPANSMRAASPAPTQGITSAMRSSG
mmetsp:Transcript_79627/g.212898  ORF Transcript_79627/g.212898 Transcript_79627/m.212898 type:complete len:255 (-) Transcript_79627:156-920(-)